MVTQIHALPGRNAISQEPHVQPDTVWVSYTRQMQIVMAAHQRVAGHDSLPDARACDNEEVDAT